MFANLFTNHGTKLIIGSLLSFIPLSMKRIDKDSNFYYLKPSTHFLIPNYYVLEKGIKIDTFGIKHPLYKCLIISNDYVRFNLNNKISVRIKLVSPEILINSGFYPELNEHKGTFRYDCRRELVSNGKGEELIRRTIDMFKTGKLEPKDNTTYFDIIFSDLSNRTIMNQNVTFFDLLFGNAESKIDESEEILLNKETISRYIYLSTGFKVEFSKREIEDEVVYINNHIN